MTFPARQSRAVLVLTLLSVAAAGVAHAGADENVRRQGEIPATNLALPKVGERIFASTDGSRFTVSYAVLPPNMRLRVFVPRVESGGYSLARSFRELQPLAIMNGGFLETYTPATPSGLVQVEGRQINGGSFDEQGVLNGVVCFGQRNNPAIVAIEPFVDARRSESYSDCLQGGPLLIRQKQFFTDLERLDAKPELKQFARVVAERSFVARNTREVVLGVTTKVSLYALRAALALDEGAGGFAAVDAIALTGRSTAGMVVAGEQPFAAGSTSRVLPNAIIVVRR